MPGHDASQLIAIAHFSESSKSVVFAAFNLHLLGLNARVLATKLGDEGRAFGVLSAEWVVLGRQFDASMKRLNEMTENLLKGTSRQLVARSRARKLAACADAVKAAGISFKGAAQAKELADLPEVRRSLRAVVDEALRACLFGRVIARSAKIEAGWNPESQALLSTLATDFENELGQILPALRTLDTIERKDLS